MIIRSLSHTTPTERKIRTDEASFSPSRLLPRVRQGEFTALRREPIGAFVYEAQPQPGEHCRIIDAAPSNFLSH